MPPPPPPPLTPATPPAERESGDASSDELLATLRAQLAAAAREASDAAREAAEAAAEAAEAAFEEHRRSVECVVCLERPRGCVLLPCSHFVACAACAASLLSAGGRAPQQWPPAAVARCPVCRAALTGFMPAFTA